MISSGAEAADRKQRIRDRYKGVDTSELEVIPAKTVEGLGESTSIRRVAAYVRVSTDNDEQTSSYELQKNYYTDYIKAQPGWEFVGIYDDEGISGTSLEHRKGMQQLIEDCKAGKIDLILTKSIARFARNIVDCLSVIETLKNLDPPVGVKFEADNIYTLDSNGRMILTILASVAEEESHSKSIIMNWSIDRRFSRGLFLTPALLGYDQDEDGSLVVNQDEAQTVKVIYYLYLNGFSFTEIAELLTEYGRKTKLGNTEWNPGTLAGVIANERHCGDVLARKTFTPNFLTHKSKKNNNDRTQYRQRDHHEAIVSREVYNAANHLRASRSYTKKNRPLPVLSVVDDGILRGYVPFDKDWTGFSAEEYREASESVMQEKQQDTVEVMNRLDLSGYEVVRAQYFATLQNPAMTISNGKLRFNTACLKKFEDVEYPDKFKIRKFGISDVIAITAAGKTAFYYVDKESLVKFNGFLAPKAEGSYLILNEGGYQIEGQTDTWKVIDEKNVQEQRFVQLVCEQTKKQKPDIVLHDSGVLVAQTIYGFDSSVMKKIEKFLREQKPELLHHQKFLENGTAERAKESGTEQNYNMIDGCVNNNPKKPRIIGNRISVLDRLHIKLEERKQKSQPQQLQQQERSRKS